MATDDRGGPMIDMIKEGLSDAGHFELAADVVLGSDGRPVWQWQSLDRVPSEEEVHAIHAAMLRAYEVHAPDEIGEEPHQFTRSPATWWQAIMSHHRASRSRRSDCDGAHGDQRSRSSAMN